MSFTDLVYLASEQLGLFTTAQAAGLGVDRSKLQREMRNGTLRSPRRGVYAFESSPFELGEELRAAWLSLDPSHTIAQRFQEPTAFVVCTTSAAAQYGIGDFDTVQHEFYTARRKQVRADDIRLRVRRLEPGDVEVRRGLALTTPTRIVMDLLVERFDLGHISRMIADALTQGLHIDWPRLASHASDHAHAYGCSPSGLLADLARASESSTNTARTALSMMTGHPQLSNVLAQQLATSLETISAALIAAQRPEVTQAPPQDGGQGAMRNNLQDRTATTLTPHLLPLPPVGLPATLRSVVSDTGPRRSESIY